MKTLLENYPYIPFVLLGYILLNAIVTVVAFADSINNSLDVWWQKVLASMGCVLLAIPIVICVLIFEGVMALLKMLHIPFVLKTLFLKPDPSLVPTKERHREIIDLWLTAKNRNWRQLTVANFSQKIYAWRHGLEFIDVKKRNEELKKPVTTKP
jgi:hypothetical protein